MADDAGAQRNVLLPFRLFFPCICHLAIPYYYRNHMMNCTCGRHGLAGGLNAFRRHLRGHCDHADPGNGPRGRAVNYGRQQIPGTDLPAHRRLHLRRVW